MKVLKFDHAVESEAQRTEAQPGLQEFLRGAVPIRLRDFLW